MVQWIARTRPRSSVVESWLTEGCLGLRVRDATGSLPLTSGADIVAKACEGRRSSAPAARASRRPAAR
eukprot:3408690-Pleurochrysis_carterae.AAC.1